MTNRISEKLHWLTNLVFLDKSNNSINFASWNSVYDLSVVSYEFCYHCCCLFTNLSLKSKCYFKVFANRRSSWFNYTGCLQDRDTDRNWDMDEWIVWFYVEPFILHLKRDKNLYLLPPITLVPVSVPVSTPDTASVITPSGSIHNLELFHEAHQFFKLSAEILNMFSEVEFILSAVSE